MSLNKCLAHLNLKHLERGGNTPYHNLGDYIKVVGTVLTRDDVLTKANTTGL